MWAIRCTPVVYHGPAAIDVNGEENSGSRRIIKHRRIVGMPPVALLRLGSNINEHRFQQTMYSRSRSQHLCDAPTKPMGL